MNCGGGSAITSKQDKVRFEFSLITIMLSVEQLQSEERIIEGRTAVKKKRKKSYNHCHNTGLCWAQFFYTGLSLFYLSYYKIATRSSQLHYGYLWSLIVYAVISVTTEI